MLKNLKAKKDGKVDTKKDTKKDKQVKKETKPVKAVAKEEEEELSEALVDINYDDKEPAVTKKIKNVNKIQFNKLEEKDIDVSNIVVEKKEEKKELKTWIVEEDKIQDEFRVKFDMAKVDTDFTSLTDDKINKELAEKRKVEVEENKDKVEEIAGFRFAPLEQKTAVNTKVDPNDPVISFARPESLNAGIPIAGLSISPPQFVNSGKGAFTSMEKTPQQLREEEADRKLNEVSVKPKSNWIGGGKKTDSVPEPEYKVSAWAAKGEDKNAAPVRFAPLQKSSAQTKSDRFEQEFKFTSKKEVDDRRKKREEEEQAEKAKKEAGKF